MSGRPPEILERFVIYLIPRGCREMLRPTCGNNPDPPLNILFARFESCPS